MSIDAKQVAELRAQTGAGIIDCKNALTDSNGDFEAAVLFLKKKGLATAAKKAERATSEGLIESYIHAGGKIGVMIQLNCETDFVAKNDGFKSLARDIAMHIAALSPQYVHRQEVPAALIDKERDIAKEQCAGKPEAAIEKIVTGKLDKFFADNCLLEQPFVKDPSITVQELVASLIAKMGENITVGKFTRYQVGS
jgi:elongation factor Ts